MSGDYDVVVVGAGPVGLTAALLLDQAGLRTALVEQRHGAIGHPAGHVINPRSMEIWRGIDAQLEAAVRNDSAAIDDIKYVVWCASLAGREIGRTRTVPGDAAHLAQQLAYSPSRHAHYPQSRLEARLWQRVLQAPKVRFLHGHTLRDLQIGGPGVSAAVEDGSGRHFNLNARYCIAADGARSSIRERLGIGMPGPLIARIASVHFRARLDRFTRRCPAVIYWIYNEHFVGPLIRHMDDEWIMMTLLHPPQTAEHFTEAHWRELIHRAIGSRAVDVEISFIGGWAMTAQTAERMRAGPVFLAGDAAHRFPPTGGYGINCGVQDVHNLVWKLKAVIDGHAGEGLLDSYEAERRPVAESNCQQSLDNQAEMDTINAAVALRMDQVKKLHQFMESRLVRALPEHWRLRFIAHVARMGLRNIRRLDGRGRRGQRLRARLLAASAQQKAHFGAHGLELGYRYRGALTLDCPHSPAELSPSELVYRASTVPGVRLPHVWLEQAGLQLSSLDLLDYGAMQLVIDPAWRDDWSQALGAQNELRYPLRLLAIGAAGYGDAVAPDSGWAQQRGVDASGAILLRPDGHVAWRARSLPADPAAALASALRDLGKAFA